MVAIVKVEVLLAQLCPTLSRQSPLSLGFSRQDYWSGLPFPFPGDLPNPGVELMSPALQADSLSHIWATRETTLLLFGYCWAVVVQSLICVWLFQPHGQKHSRLPWPSPSLWVCSNTCPFSQWCHPTIQPPSDTLFSFCLQSFPGSGSFPMNHLYIFLLK